MARKERVIGVLIVCPDDGTALTEGTHKWYPSSNRKPSLADLPSGNAGERSTLKGLIHDPRNIEDLPEIIDGKQWEKHEIVERFPDSS